MKFVILLQFFLLLSGISHAQIAVNEHNLYSTHGNWFRGISLTGYKPFKLHKNLSVGAGIEYSNAPLHNDNDWVLTKLNFVPIFLDLRYQSSGHKTFQSYVHIAQGVSIISYYRKDFTVLTPYKVKERGYFASAGIGATTRITAVISACAEIGMKAFHISGNDMDVNPHGITGSIGVLFRPVKKK